MITTLLCLLAQTTTSATTGSTEAGPGGFLKNFMPILIGIAVLYFFVFRAKKNQDKQRQEMLDKLKPGQKIQTIGGIIGTISQANDREVTVKVDENNNVKIKFLRSAIHRVIEEEKTEPAK